MRSTKRNLLTLFVALVVLYFGYVSTASIKGWDVLTSLIKSRSYLEILEFHNERIQPDVRINGTEVLKCTGGISGSCIMGNILVLPPNFCSLATSVTLYPQILGSPPSPETFTGLELCNQFPHIEPTRESEENDHSCWNVHLGYDIAIIIIIILLSPGNIFGVYSYFKNRSHTKENDKTGHCSTKLTELINKVACSSTLSTNWECLCEKECFLLKPNLFNYDGKSYAIFVVKNESERSNCIDPHLEKYQQNFHVANVFVVYMEDVDAATSADHLQVWYKEYCNWDHSLLKNKVFLPMPVSLQSSSGNFTSGVMDNDGAIRKHTEVPEHSHVEDMPRTLISEQAARLSDTSNPETDVSKSVDAVTNEDPDKTAKILPTGLVGRSLSSRSMARSGGVDENTMTTQSTIQPQDDTLKFFTGEQGEFEAIDNEEDKC